jgi:hypothetical protein
LLKYCRRRYKKEIKIEREKWRKKHENWVYWFWFRWRM